MAAAPLDTAGFRDALVILGSAGLVIPAFYRFKINPVIGFILVGLLIGPDGLGRFAGTFPLQYMSINDREAIEPFAEFGIILLLFSIGLELSARRLWDLRRLVFLLGPGQMLVSAGAIGLILYWTGSSLLVSVALGLALSLSSTALVLPMTGTKSAVGKPAFSMLLFEDVALVPIIFILGILNPTLGADAAVDDLLNTLWLGGLTIGIIWLIGHFVLPRLFHQAALTKSPELFLAAALVVVMAASLATSAAGLSPIVGALIAGLLIAETEYRAQVEAMVEPFKNLALGVFLITIGMSLDFQLIAAEWPMILLAIVGVVLVKTLVTGGLLRLAGASKGLSANVGLLMASPSETTLIVLGAALSAGIIGAGDAAFWQIVTAIGLTATPLLARAGRDAERRVDKDADMPARLPDPAGGPKRTIIVGFGRVGQMVAEMMSQHQQAFVLVDADIGQVRRGQERGLDIFLGDVARPQILELMGLDEARALVLTMDDPVQTVATTRAVREKYPTLCIVARARDTEHAAQLYRAGATDAVPETLESSLQLAEAVLVDIGRPMGPVIASIHEMRDVERAKIKAMAPEIRKEPLRAASRIGLVSDPGRDG